MFLFSYEQAWLWQHSDLFVRFYRLWPKVIMPSQLFFQTYLCYKTHVIDAEIEGVWGDFPLLVCFFPAGESTQRDRANFRCLQHSSNSCSPQQCTKLVIFLLLQPQWDGVQSYANRVCLFSCFVFTWDIMPCVSLWVLLTVVFFSDAELSVLRCHLIPIIRFVLLCISEMKRLVVTPKACNQHELCQTVPKLTLWLCACEKETTWQNVAGKSLRKGGSYGDSKTTVLHTLWLT